MSPPDRSRTASGGLENHSWYIVTTHMKPKHIPIIAPPMITTQANGWYNLTKYQELISDTSAMNGLSLIHI